MIWSITWVFSLPLLFCGYSGHRQQQFFFPILLFLLLTHGWGNRGEWGVVSYDAFKDYPELPGSLFPDDVKNVYGINQTAWKFNRNLKMLFLLENCKVNKPWRFYPRLLRNLLKFFMYKLFKFYLNTVVVDSMKHKRNKNLDRHTFKMWRYIFRTNAAYCSFLLVLPCPLLLKEKQIAFKSIILSWNVVSP